MDMTATPETAVPAPPETDHLDQIAPAQPGEEDDDDFSDDPDIIFRREYSKLDTVLLTPSVPLRLYILFVLFFAAFIGGAVIGLVTYPTITVTIVPVSHTITTTAPLDLQIRQLAPVTITTSQTAPTTGHGHQDARTARGMLTLYNGLFTPQTISVGTVFTASNGIKVVTDETVTIPAGNPPFYGQARLSAHAITPGEQGNIPTGEITSTLSNGVLVKNDPFSGGRDARDFQAVAPIDLDTLTSTVKNTLVQQISQAFPLRSGETVYPTTCHFSTTADHGAGEEATTLTVKATYTCKGIVYSQDELQQRATTAFINQTNPGVQYELVSTTPPQVVSLAPFTVRMSGTWVYVLSEDYQQFLAEKIAGDSPKDARAYLLRTGVITRALVPAQLPKDPGHIHFSSLIGA